VPRAPPCFQAPLLLQQAAGCVIGKDYPEPIVDHPKISKINMGKMKLAFDASKAAAAGAKHKAKGGGDSGKAAKKPKTKK